MPIKTGIGEFIPLLSKSSSGKPEDYTPKILSASNWIKQRLYTILVGPERDLGTAVIVDDDENQRIMASELLQRINSHVWAVASGEETVA